MKAEAKASSSDFPAAETALQKEIQALFKLAYKADFSLARNTWARDSFRVTKERIKTQLGAYLHQQDNSHDWLPVPRDVMRLGWLMARCDLTDPALFSLLWTHAHRQIAAFSTHELTAFVWASAKAGGAPQKQDKRGGWDLDDLERSVEVLIDRLGDFNSKHAVKMLWCLGRLADLSLKHSDGAASESAAAAEDDEMEEDGTKESSDTAYFSPESSFRREVMEIDFEIWDGDILSRPTHPNRRNGEKAASHQPPRSILPAFVSGLSRVLTGQVSQLPTVELATCLWCLTKIHLMSQQPRHSRILPRMKIDRNLFHSVAKSASQRLNEFRPHGLSVVLWSHARTGFVPPPSLISNLKALLTSGIRLGRQGRMRGKGGLVRKGGLGRSGGMWEARHVAMVTRSLATINSPRCPVDGEVFAALSGTLVSGLDGLKLSTLPIILHAFVTAGQLDSALSRCIRVRVTSNTQYLSRLSPVALYHLLAALCHMHDRPASEAAGVWEEWGPVADLLLELKTEGNLRSQRPGALPAFAQKRMDERWKALEAAREHE
ncbi:unnamed protein product [Vitrella brassicaformis CCMP3155]|uniref:Uncharacterized protein n=1 Tax=Vitrella brassicaformis (strain CCMP3155) TaxID=1169540 RepID=A0A0G4EQD9_VITBC|nr:unnamed protein product [Vitrella brassicaformis CCMP3155]|eukprot:CEL99681.1 unnamed protein product [Vitrella brassicaformis CCMP3155]